MNTGTEENTGVTRGSADRLQEILVGKISPSRYQPRKKFDEAALQELANSIKGHGLLQPIVVWLVDEAEGTYELIAGERRWRAFQILKREKISAIVKVIDIKTARELALIENLQREDLTLMEEAECISVLVLENDNNIHEVAKKIGKGRSITYVQDRLVLVTLPDSVKTMVSNGEINIAQAKVIAGLKEENDQIEAAKLAVRLQLNADQLRGRTQNKKKKDGGNTGGDNNRATVRYDQVSNGLVRLYEVVEGYDFSMLRDENKRATLRNQIVLVQRSLADTLEKLTAPVPEATPSE